MGSLKRMPLKQSDKVLVMSAEPRSFRLTVTQPGLRLDRFVAENCPGISRTQAQRLIDDGRVMVNGKRQRAAYKLAAGDAVSVEIPPPTPSPLAAEDIPVRTIYEDEDILVVDKPAGLAVHPAPGHKGGTLVNAMVAHLGKMGSENERPGIVHRLDKDTSGVMVIARNPAALTNLSDQFKGRTVTKTYVVLVKGRLKPQEGIIEAAIGRHPGDRKKMMVTGVGRGREAVTRYRVCRYIGDYTLLEVMPRTGRTHQIRVHLAAIGFPVVGDTRYGIASKTLSRQFLHAVSLKLKLPSSGKDVEFTSPLPADLERALKEVEDYGKI
jgi:23S rRNA pseudouridine1911/1915/1917 synthase